MTMIVTLILVFRYFSAI